MRFENTTMPHNKYYEVNMLETPTEGEWIVLAESGPIGGSARRYEKGRGNFEYCSRIYTKIVKKRIKNGYTKVE